MPDPFANYDSWLEAPYQKAAAEGEARECKECGEGYLEDDEDGVTCDSCGYSIGPPDPYDEAQDRRMEERYEDRADMGVDGW